MLVLTITPNPAFDITYYLPEIKFGHSNRVQKSTERPGGKGINVARVFSQVFANHSKTVASTGFLGTKNGSRLGEMLTECAPNISQKWAWVEGSTRHTVATVDNQTVTVFNEPGPSVRTEEWQNLAEVAKSLVNASDVAVISGSLPPGSSESDLAKLVAELSAMGVKVLVDTSGPGLMAAAKAGAWLLKPNHHEIKEALGCDDEISGGKELLAAGAGAVVISLAEAGMLAMTNKDNVLKVWQARPVKMIKGNATGAGDACVAALTEALCRCVDRSDLAIELPQILPTAVALSGAAVLSPVAGEVDIDNFEKMRSLIKVEEINVFS